MKLKLSLIISAFFLVTVSVPAFAQSDDLVILHTKSGDIVIEFFPDDAPNHVENFMDLTQSGFYDKTIFHRVIEGFMIQGGDPFTKPSNDPDFTSKWGTGDPGYEIDAEFNDIKHNRGIVSMARSSDPNSAGSQFFIVHQDSNFLDGQYTVFGRIVTQESFETLDKIATLEISPVRDIPFDWGKGEILTAEVVPRSQVTNLLELDEPERITESIEIPPLSENYSNDKFGFSSTFPTGWLVQEPEKTHPLTPDVVAVGPISNGFNPLISISALDTILGDTLEEQVEKTKASIQPAIDVGQATIISEEYTKINDKNAHVLTTTSLFQTEGGIINIKFREIILETSGEFFTITYANTVENFDNDLRLYDETVNSFKTNSEDSNPLNGGGCLIATAAFGSELAPQVQMLRELRDNTVLSTTSGTAFMTGFNQFYYSFSPTIADWERENPVFQEVVKITITPLLTSLSILNHVDIDSEEEMLGYGISLILLNIGMYFAAPAYIFYRLRK